VGNNFAAGWVGICHRPNSLSVTTMSQPEVVVQDLAPSISPIPPSPSQSGCIYTVLGHADGAKDSERGPQIRLYLLLDLDLDWTCLLGFRIPVNGCSPPLTVDRAVVSAQNNPNPRATSTASLSHLIQVHIGLQPYLLQAHTLFQPHKALQDPFYVPPRRQISSSLGDSLLDTSRRLACSTIRTSFNSQVKFLFIDHWEFERNRRQ
jgi:hypothetical protein